MKKTKQVAAFQDDATSHTNFLSIYLKAIDFVNAVNNADIQYEAYSHVDGEGNSNSVAYQSIEAMGFTRPAASDGSPGSGTDLNIKGKGAVQDK